MLKQRSQNTTWSRTAMSAAASVRASASGRAEQVVGQALGGLRPDPGQPRERLDQPGDRLDERGGHGSRSHPRQAKAAGHGRHLLLGQVARHAQRLVDRGKDEVLQHLDVVRVDRRRVDRDADSSCLPVATR